MPLFVLAGAVSSSADTFTPLCEKDSPYYCWRDPSDGGPGNEVVVSGYGTDNARLWDRMTDYSRCGGQVSNANACPFTPGSGWNSFFNGDRIVIVQNLGSGYCAGSNDTEYPYVYMHACDGIKGQTELSSVFVEEDFSDHYRLVSVGETDNCYIDNQRCFLTVDGSNYNDDQLQVYFPGSYDGWTGG
jgi:hypothetical protein